MKTTYCIDPKDASLAFHCGQQELNAAMRNMKRSMEKVHRDEELSFFTFMVEMSVIGIPNGYHINILRHESNALDFDFTNPHKPSTPLDWYMMNVSSPILVPINLKIGDTIV